MLSRKGAIRSVIKVANHEFTIETCQRLYINNRPALFLESLNLFQFFLELGGLVRFYGLEVCLETTSV